METQRTKPDIRLDLAPFDDDTLRKAATYLVQGTAWCKKHEDQAGAAELGKLLLALAVLVGHHLPDPPAPPMTSMN